MQRLLKDEYSCAGKEDRVRLPCFPRRVKKTVCGVGEGLGEGKGGEAGAGQASGPLGLV